MSRSVAASLLCHPATPCAVVHAIAANATAQGNGDLIVNYRIHGDPAGIRLPAPRPARACDGLWQHTCCELFVASGTTPGAYREFNFSPSGEWAAYRFSAYRERESDAGIECGPAITLQKHADGFELSATLPATLLPAAADLHLGLTAVIEAVDGRKSYWALAHAAAQPDFHLHPSFSLNLKAVRA